MVFLPLVVNKLYGVLFARPLFLVVLFLKFGVLGAVRSCSRRLRLAASNVFLQKEEALLISCVQPDEAILAISLQYPCKPNLSV